MDVTTVVIGAGHSGLAMSHQLTERAVDHVVVERGEVANSWRTERWDSLRLLSPNCECKLPGWCYDGDDPDGFMAVPEVVAFMDSYASSFNAPILTGTAVTRVASSGRDYQVTTSGGVWNCETVVLASGAANLARVPSLAAAVPMSIDMVTPMTYRSPECLDERAVLVVGASATGVQLADEILRSGRHVTIAVGEHVRLPRTYRGHDIFWWMNAAGVHDERYDDVDDLVRARHIPSPQLIGSPERRAIDLNSLTQLGVQTVGRLCTIRDGVAQFSGGLANRCQLADLKMNYLLDRLDSWAHHTDTDALDPPCRFEPTSVASNPTLEIDLGRQGIGTIVWATGYCPDYSWLDLPVLDRKGRIRHDGGVVSDAPGMYVLGGNLLRTRRSSFIAGAEQDTSELANHLHEYLDRRTRLKVKRASSRGRPVGRPHRPFGAERIWADLPASGHPQAEP